MTPAVTSIPVAKLWIIAVSPQAKAYTIAGRSSVSLRTMPTPVALPSRVGLTTRGKLRRSPTACITAGAPNSRNVDCGNSTNSGTAIPVPATNEATTGLSNARRRAAAEEPTRKTSNAYKTSRRAPSSPAAPCRSGTVQTGRCPLRIGSRFASTSASAISHSGRAVRRTTATRLPEPFCCSLGDPL